VKSKTFLRVSEVSGWDMLACSSLISKIGPTGVSVVGDGVGVGEVVSGTGVSVPAGIDVVVDVGVGVHDASSEAKTKRPTTTNQTVLFFTYAHPFLHKSGDDLHLAGGLYF
jgi:hypothetical protein